jgi:hypothetical protein
MVPSNNVRIERWACVLDSGPLQHVDSYDDRATSVLQLTRSPCMGRVFTSLVSRKKERKEKPVRFDVHVGPKPRRLMNSASDF